MPNKPRLYIISGAGLSAESGISTFRDSDGLWTKYDVDRVCNALTWKRHREEVFQFYSEVQATYSECKPNRAHEILADWQKRWGKDRVILLTQNVDLLLEKAGAEEVIHLHGEVGKLQCTACAHVWESEVRSDIRCPKCDSLKGVKPAIVMFHEMAPNYIHLSRMRKHTSKHDMIIFVGSSGQVIAPASVVPPNMFGSEHVISVNLDESTDDLFGVIGVHYIGKATEVLAELERDVINQFMGE